MVNLLKKLISKVKFKCKMIMLDMNWNFTNGRCFSVFPPSFYYTHSKEEAARIEKETKEELRKLINEYKSK